MPAESVVRLVVAMALFAADSIPKVLRRPHPTRDRPEPTDSAFSQARRRLGVAPLRRLFHETARPMAAHQTVGAFYRAWRLKGLDGTILDVPDIPENDRTFGRPTTGRAEGAFPQVRLLTLCELGTHAVCGLATKPLCHGETSMVGQPLDHLGPGDLLIWDRGFLSHKLIRSVVQQGAHLVARVSTAADPPPRRRLSPVQDLSGLERPPSRPRRAFGPRHRVHSHDPNRPGMGERHRLITGLTNPEDMPAREAPMVYHSPAGVVQEIYGMMPAHYMVRRVIHDASAAAGRDPDRLSFLDSLRVLQCQLPESPCVAAETWYQRLLREVRRQELRPRRDRWHARVIKRKMSSWMKKRPEHRDPPQPTKPSSQG